MENKTPMGAPLTLNPTESQQDSRLDAVPTLQPVTNSDYSTNGESYSAGTVDENMLTGEEKEMVEKFAAQIDISNVEQTVTYGEVAQRNISDFSVSILKRVKTYALGDVGQSLKELTVALDDTTRPEKKGVFGFFQKAKRGVNSIRANYTRAESNVNRIEQDLRAHREILVQDISTYQQMYELNVQYYRELTMYIIAGKKALERARSGKLQELKDKASICNRQEDVQAYKDYEDLCYRFEKKLADLEITRMISIQSAPQIRLLQNNDREMLDKLQSSLSNTIPLWRNQLVLSLGIEHSKRALQAQSTLADKTNELLARNSATLKMATIGTAKEVERPIVDISTLRQCNRDLIDSLNEVVQIHNQSATERAKARDELIRIEEELKQAMKEVGRPSKI